MMDHEKMHTKRNVYINERRSIVKVRNFSTMKNTYDFLLVSLLELVLVLVSVTGMAAVWVVALLLLRYTWTVCYNPDHPYTWRKYHASPHP